VSQDAEASARYHPEPGTVWETVGELGTLFPQRQQLVTLANWQESQNVHWSFQHMRELMPSHVIEGTDEPRLLPEALTNLGAITLPQEHNYQDVATVIEATETDGLLVLHQGQIVAEYYRKPMTRRRRHLVMSVSKSIVSTVAASLWAEGLLDPGAPAEHYAPELTESGYAGVRVRDLLDMRTGIKFAETYLDSSSEVRLMERAMGWAPRHQDDPLGMYSYILSIESQGAHGDVFDYRSIDTDTLGWVCERAAGRRMADLVSERIWQPIGAFHDAEITADPLGAGIHDGGISATLRDLGRFGLMLLNRGEVAERQVIPAAWIDTAFAPPADVRDAFARSVNEPYLPGAWYRNQFWMVPGPNGPIMLCLGIHGQMIYVDPVAELVGVKLSSWPLPQDSPKLNATIAAFTAIGSALK
jgi:CubicO group peptidase (beta-lactamase class C family)